MAAEGDEDAELLYTASGTFGAVIEAVAGDALLFIKDRLIGLHR